MQTPAEIPGQHLIQRCVIMQRDDKGYGLTVTGDNPVYVQSVKSGGAADRAGVRVGDKIVKVNGTLVTNSNHKEVVNLIKGGSYVALTLLGKPPSTGQANSGGPRSPLGSTRGNSVSGTASPTSPIWDNAEEKIKAIRRYLEQEQLFIKNIQSQYTDTPTPKLEKELAESKKRAKALEQELQALTTNRNTFLHLTGEISPTESVFDPSLSPNSPLSKRRHFSETPGYYDNVQSGVSAQPKIVTTQPSDEHLDEENPPSTYPGFQHPRQHSNPERLTAERNGSFVATNNYLRRKPGIRNSSRSKSLPGRTRNREIYEVVTEAQEKGNRNRNDNSDFKESEDVNDFGLGSLSTPVMGESQQPIVSMDDDEFPSEEEKCEDHGPFNDLTLLKNKPAHMAVFLHYLISNVDPTSLLFWIVTDGYEEGSAKDMRRWIYEIYSTFFADGALEHLVTVASKNTVELQLFACYFRLFYGGNVTEGDGIAYVVKVPLRVELEFMTEGIKKIEESVLGNQKSNEDVLRNLLKPLRTAAAKEVSLFLTDFRAKRALGLGSLFGDHQLEGLLKDVQDDNMDRNKEITVVEQTLLPHLDALVKDVDSYSQNFNESKDIEGIMGQIFRSEALSCAIATFMKQVGIVYRASSPNTHVLEKCKTFMHKESSSSFLRSAKKDKKKVIKLHTFHAFLYTTTTYCNLCRQLIWGIGHQGYQCQVCEYNVHRRRCLNAVDEPCTAKKKERIVTRSNSERRSSGVKLSENSDLLSSPDNLRDDDLKRKSFDGTSPTTLTGNLDTEQDIERPLSLFETPKSFNFANKVNRSTSVLNKSEYQRRKVRSKTEVVQPSVFIPGVSRIADSSYLVESGDEETADSDLDVPNEMPSIKDQIDSKTYRALPGKERKRLELINELIHTERTHVRTLKVLHKVFYKPWMKAKIEYENIRNILFPNLDDLIRIHKSLVQAMKKRQANSEYVSEIGDLLLDRFDNQPGEEAKEAFAKFCQSQNYALEMLKVKIKKERKLDEFIQLCESNPLCRKLSLQGIISSSYQRLTKYPLFIEALIKATQVTNDDHPRLKKVLLICKQILEYVNQAVKDFEDQQRLAEFNRRLDKRPVESTNHKMMEDFKNLDLTKHKLIFDGPLTWRMNQTKNIDLHALLLEDLLVLLQKQDDKYVLKCQSMSMRGYQDNKKTTHSPILKLSSLLTRNVATDKKAFFVVGTSEVGPQIYELVAATLSERKNWFKFITEAIDVCKGKERGRRNALAMPTAVTAPTEMSEDEKQEFETSIETKESDDNEKEKSGGEEAEENTVVDKESRKDINEEKEKDSEETVELPLKNKLVYNLMEKKRSHSVDDLTNEISVDSPAKEIPVFLDTFDTNGGTEGFKKKSPSAEDISETSEGSSRSSVEIMELLKQKDEEIRRLLEEKSRLVEQIRGSPSTEGLASKENSVSENNLDARYLVVSSILEVNRLTGAVTSILNPSEGSDRSQNSEENPLPPPQQLAKSTAILNEYLTTLLNVIADRDMNRERLHCDMQYANAQIQKLKQERYSRSFSHPSHSDDTFLPNYDEPGNWDSVNDKLPVPDNYNDISRPIRSSSFSGCSESSRSSRGSNRNSLIMSTELTDSCDV